MKIFVIFAAVLVVAHADSLEEQWHEFKVTHEKSYKTFMEEMSRFIIFQDNIREIEKHNEKFAKGEVSYSKGINQFADMTQEEFDATMPPLTPPPSFFYDEFNVSEEIEEDEELGVNQEINWVKKGIVAPVRNQGKCGSCWAFSVAGTIESQVMKQRRKLVILSPQNLVDCARHGSNGCRSGNPDYAFEYVKRNGILQESEYPYVMKQGPCRKKGGQRIARYVRLPRNENKLLQALYYNGPTILAVDARALKHYKSGIIDKSSGCTDKPTHAVILVGSGVENGKKYWLVQNSWSDKWGDKGYFKIVRGVGACGVGIMCSYPKL